MNHLLTHSCALHLLSTYPSVFATGLSPPPRVYLISPWSPPLPATDPLAYQQPLDWIPSALLTTQDITLPYVIPAVKSAEEAYSSATKAVGGAVEAVRNWWGGLTAKPDASPEAAAAAAVDALAAEEQKREMSEKEEVAEDGIPVPDDVQANETQEEATPRRRLWAPSAKYVSPTLPRAFADSAAHDGLPLRRGLPRHRTGTHDVSQPRLEYRS